MMLQGWIWFYNDDGDGDGDGDGNGGNGDGDEIDNDIQEMGAHLVAHGDGVKDVSFAVEDLEGIMIQCRKKGVCVMIMMSVEMFWMGMEGGKTPGRHFLILHLLISWWCTLKSRRRLGQADLIGEVEFRRQLVSEIWKSKQF